jgi:transposase
MRSNFRTPYCHMTYENSKQKQIAARLDMVRYAQKHGIKPAGRKFGCSKNTVKVWKLRYETRGSSGLLNLSRRPHSSPNKIASQEERHIIQCRRKAPCYGPKRLKWAYDISTSSSAIYRVLKENSLLNRRRKKYQRKQDLRAVKAAKYKALDHQQKEFFDLEKFEDSADFWIKIQAYQYFYNCIRPNFSKQGKVPWQIVQEDRPGIDPKLLLFPVIDLDKLFCARFDGVLNEVGGQYVQKLPVSRIQEKIATLDGGIEITSLRKSF